MESYLPDTSADCGNSLASFMQRRLGAHVLLLPATAEHDLPAHAALIANYADSNDLAASTVKGLVLPAEAALDPIGVQLDVSHSLVAARVSDNGIPPTLILCKLAGSLEVAQLTLANALECWKLSRELQTNRMALEESAMQLAQSFEEQSWLRGFARNASSFTKNTSANHIANGILKPLGYLMRAQDIFLIVDPAETDRSGLCSAKYGTSKFQTPAIQALLQELQVGATTPPVVRNNASLATPNGLIHSLVIVSVVGAEHALGHLVTINRCAEAHADGLPVYDSEFGSGDVGLLEEAAILLSTQAHNVHLLVQSNQLFLGTLHAMSSAIDARDPYTQGHSERVARLSFDLAKIMGLSEEACQEIYLSGILHDIGKIGVPDRVLLKEGPLDNEEYAIIQQHPEIGYRIVQRVGNLQFALPGILYHHERWDGRGYPHKLQGEAIPMMARIMAVADGFDAMTSSRPYRNAMPVEKARQIICAGRGEQWNAEAVECFLIWLQQQTSENSLPLPLNQSIIPQGSTVDFLMQAAVTLGL